jgi:hypothetical protein
MSLRQIEIMNPRFSQVGGFDPGVSLNHQQTKSKEGTK